MLSRLHYQYIQTNQDSAGRLDDQTSQQYSYLEKMSIPKKNKVCIFFLEQFSF